VTGGFDVDLTGRTAVVTGATTGLGKEIARGLLRLGATVVIGARDAGRGTAAAADLAGDARGGEVAVLDLDVSVPASIGGFAAAFRDRYATLDILVNNAGAWFTDRRLSADGIELTLATNVVGPYVLTEALSEPLRAAGSARVVNVVSSIAGDYDATDLGFERRDYNGFKAYAQSKQALRMLTWGLAYRLAGTRVTANAAAPGFVRTEFNRNARGMQAAMINVSARLFGASPAKGADTPLWASVAPELGGVTGKYFVGRAEKDGGIRDAAAIRDLERRCDRLVASTAG
jgi:NAD(P)-dependent dehydrogenase (short-subunit alcohol dehydrogenase family)